MLYLCGVSEEYIVLGFISYRRRRIGMHWRIGIDLGLFLSFQMLEFLLCFLVTGCDQEGL